MKLFLNSKTCERDEQLNTPNSTNEDVIDLDASNDRIVEANTSK